MWLFMAALYNLGQKLFCLKCTTEHVRRAGRATQRDLQEMLMLADMPPDIVQHDERFHWSMVALTWWQLSSRKILKRRHFRFIIKVHCIKTQINYKRKQANYVVIHILLKLDYYFIFFKLMEKDDNNTLKLKCRQLVYSGTSVFRKCSLRIKVLQNWGVHTPSSTRANAIPSTYMQHNKSRNNALENVKSNCTWLVPLYDIMKRF